MLEEIDRIALEKICADLPEALVDEDTFRSIFERFMALLNACEYLICERSGPSNLILPKDDREALETTPLASNFGGIQNKLFYFRNVNSKDRWGTRGRSLPVHEAVFMSEVTDPSLGEDPIFDHWLAGRNIADAIYVKICNMPIGYIGLNFFFSPEVKLTQRLIELTNEISRKLAPFVEPYFKRLTPDPMLNPERQIELAEHPMLVVSKSLNFINCNSAATNFLSKTSNISEGQFRFLQADRQALFEHHCEQVLNSGQPAKLDLFNSAGLVPGTLHICFDYRPGKESFLISLEEQRNTYALNEDEIDQHLMGFAKYLGIIVDEKSPPEESIKFLKPLILSHSNETIYEEYSISKRGVNKHIYEVLLGRIILPEKYADIQSKRRAVPLLFQDYLNDF